MVDACGSGDVYSFSLSLVVRGMVRDSYLFALILLQTTKSQEPEPTSFEIKPQSLQNLKQVFFAFTHV
jgi:hypothetical protein